MVIMGGNAAEPPKLLLQILDEKYPGQTYVVQVHTGFVDAQCNTDIEANLAGWTTPALAPVKGTWLEAVQCPVFPSNRMMRALVRIQGSGQVPTFHYGGQLSLPRHARCPHHVSA